MPLDREMGDRPPPSPGDLAVSRARLIGIATAMGHALRRGAVSPNIAERADCSTAVFDAEGRLVVQAEHIPVHLGSMPASVQSALSWLGTTGHKVDDETHVVLNDPFSGGTHLNDVTVVSPVLIDGRVVAWLANRAHHADVGGPTPGSLSVAHTELFGEGFCIPPTLYSPDLVRLFAANSRGPQERTADLSAQIGANRVGRSELTAAVGPLTEMFGALSRCFDAQHAYARRRVQRLLAPHLNKTAAATGELNIGAINATVACTVGVIGDESQLQLIVDWSESSDQTDSSVNAVRAISTSAVSYALRCIFDPGLPAGFGVDSSIQILTRPGSVVDAIRPCAVGAGNVEVSQLLAQVAMRAFEQLRESQKRSESPATMNNLIIGSGSQVYYETMASGQGAFADADGATAMHTGMTNTQNTPIEALERAYPFRVVEYRVARGSGGQGQHCGGDGMVRTIETLQRATVTVIGSHRTRGASGANGAAGGMPGEDVVVRSDGCRVRLDGASTVTLEPGDRITVVTPSGPGWNAPLEASTSPRQPST